MSALSWRLLASLCTTALLLSGAPGHAAAFCRLTTVDPPQGQLCSEEGRALRWLRPDTTLSLLPRNNQEIPEEDIREIIQASFDTWSEVECNGRSVRIVADLRDEPATEEEPDHHEIGRNENAIMFVDSSSEWRDRNNEPSAIGLTSVFHNKRTGTIVGADMEINDWQFHFGVCRGECTPGITDLQNVFTHEAGHYYGLGHVADNEATMFAQASDGEIHKRDLAADDIEGICAIYPAAFAEDGCGCAVIGASTLHDSRWRWALPLALLLVLRIARRARRATEIVRAGV